ncbi:MAG TPA: type II toxin-antitoxin system ParD family antitoxin [Sphingomonas sp.]|jgi:antitoxin ParD1/3/4|uniref:ribbon-helix-helix domain-containing protein n=1 Tax=Sphingomonas sp. TaxID=28214 RepID=UPI002EDB4A04
MAQLHLSLPEDLSNWAESRAAQGGYADPADYVRDIVRRDRDREEKLARLQAAIDEGRQSGVGDRDPFAYLAELRAGLRRSSGSADAA